MFDKLIWGIIAKSLCTSADSSISESTPKLHIGKLLVIDSYFKGNWAVTECATPKEHWTIWCPAISEERSSMSSDGGIKNPVQESD